MGRFQVCNWLVATGTELSLVETDIFLGEDEKDFVDGASCLISAQLHQSTHILSLIAN